jgi:hypothetical protein
MRLWRLKLYVSPFARVLRLIRTHILTTSSLTGNNRADVALDHYHNAFGFSLLLTDEERSATMGDEFALRRSAELTASLPCRARIRLVRSGSLFCQIIGKESRSANPVSTGSKST